MQQPRREQKWLSYDRILKVNVAKSTRGGGVDNSRGSMLL